ncbi:hypothetical protein WN55_05211 [Dufourea novaeangliae]|uniref:Uncharacterized protein n=1 Tax=Dufourea novaeangliae TaxID=178035 RepID=A0A154PQW7_DUFNO|nr:hypothetical protein WN55_05211 [Dufourea novaeangliae]
MRGRIPELGKPDQFPLINTKLYSNHGTMANSECVAGTKLTLLPSSDRYAELPAKRAYPIGSTRPVRKQHPFRRERFRAISAILDGRSNSMKATTKNGLRYRKCTYFFKSTILNVCLNNAVRDILNSCNFHQVDEEIRDFKSKLLESRKECENVEIEICDVSQLKDKGLFVLKDIERKYKQLERELNDVHCQYTEHVREVNSYEKTVYRKIECLTLQRDKLKKELEQLQKSANKNDKKLVEIRTLITCQEQKNMALLRKLKKMKNRTNVSQDLKGRINTVLCDSRITKINVPNQNII